ncbi:MAG: hypothetical protein J6J14_06030 [Rikenellaceae bacterium]|nr:hypothetical protein [Rikenellaceae bacterium]
MKLYIDEKLCRTDSATVAPKIGFDATDLNRFEALRAGRRYRLSIPICRTNRAIIGYDDRVLDATSFNDADHKARIEFDGATLIEGTVLLVAVERNVAGGRFEIEVISGAHEWARTASLRRLNEVAIDFESAFDSNAIIDSWNGDSVVRMLPVLRDRYSDVRSEVELMPVQQIPALTDFHPFVRVPRLVEAIFADAGYTIDFPLLATEPFSNLVMSGRFAERDTSRLDARMGFRAGRSEATTAVADEHGMVYANPFTSLNTVGNLVDTVAPSEEAADLHAADDSFRIEEGGAIFSPPEKVTASIVCQFHYLTDYRIATRYTLRGFDTICLDVANQYKFALANRFVDHRPTIRAGMEYRVVVFNHIEGSNYRLMYIAKKGTTATEQLAVEFSSDNALLTIPANVTPYEPTLMYRHAGANAYLPCPNDWALYAGYVEMEGQTEVEVTVATTPREVSASEPFEFRKIAFAGAAEGQSMTLYASTRAYPSFQPNPALGSTFTLADVMHHDLRQVDLLEALAQMFNLRFYTDPIERKVYIRSAAEMIDREQIVDWSDRIIDSLPITVGSLAERGDEATRHRYQVGDGAVARYNQQHDDRYGEWVGEVRSKLADEGERDACNPIFAPTINASELFALAPSVSLPQVGDRDADDPAQLNFPTKILIYHGLQILPEGERWGLLAGAYPLADFHSTEGSLCFEDRDGAEGLHRYYDAHYEELNEARYVTLSLRLSAADLLPIIATDPAGRDLRAVYRLVIGGEEELYRLDAIEEFRAEECVARCRFVQLV